ADGKILVGGTDVESSFGVSTEPDLFVCRFNTNGSLDESFGNNSGGETVDFGDVEYGSAMAVDRNGTPKTNPYYGTIVIAGTHIYNGAYDIAIARLTPDGQLDRGDGSSGFARGDGQEDFKLPHE